MFFFQPHAIKILSTKVVGQKNVVCVVSENANGKKVYENLLMWKVISFRSKKRGGALIASEKVVENQNNVMALLDEY